MRKGISIRKALITILVVSVVVSVLVAVPWLANQVYSNVLELRLQEKEEENKKLTMELNNVIEDNMLMLVNKTDPISYSMSIGVQNDALFGLLLNAIMTRNIQVKSVYLLDSAGTLLNGVSRMNPSSDPTILTTEIDQNELFHHLKEYPEIVEIPLKGKQYVSTIQALDQHGFFYLSVPIMVNQVSVGALVAKIDSQVLVKVFEESNTHNIVSYLINNRGDLITVSTADSLPLTKNMVALNSVSHFLTHGNFDSWKLNAVTMGIHGYKVYCSATTIDLIGVAVISEFKKNLVREEVFSSVIWVLLIIFLVTVILAVGTFWLIDYLLHPISEASRKFEMVMMGDYFPIEEKDSIIKETTALTLGFNKLISELKNRDADLDKAQAVGKFGYWRMKFGVVQDYFVSSELKSMFGITEKKVHHPFLTYIRCVHPNDMARFINAVRFSIDSKTKMELEHKLVINSIVLHVISTAEFTFAKGGKPIIAIGTVQNITERRQLEKKLVNAQRGLIEVQDNERQRIASELHDGLVQTLTLTSLNLDLITTTHGTTDLDLGSKLKSTTKLINSAIAECRAISHNLMPSTLNDFGIVSSLEMLVKKVNEMDKVKMIFIHNNLNSHFYKYLEVNMYRIVQEAVNNILKYSKAKNATLQLIDHGDTLMLLIEDDGVGFDVDNDSNGLGLKNIKNRVLSLNGTIEIDSFNGTSLTIEIPIRYEQESEPLNS